jgi:hypothetical protein
VARGIFGNILKIGGLLRIFVDCGLISKKGDGLTTKSTGIFQRGFFFQWEIRWTQSTIRGPWAVPVHGGPRTGPRRWLARGQPSSRSGPRWLTGGGATESGVHGESILGLTGARAAVWRSGNGDEETVEEVLSAGGAWAWREEKESGERCSEDRAGHHPFIEGRTGVEELGLHGQRQCLGFMALVIGVKMGRGCDCCQLMRGQVKKGKSRSLGLHGIGGREGAAHMVRVARRGGSGASAGSVGEGRGKGIHGRWAGSAC